MDILYIANARMPTEKAHGFQIVKTIEALDEQGVEVELLIPKRPNSIKATVTEYYSLKRPIRIKYITIPFNFLTKMAKPIYFKLERFYFNIAALLYAIADNRTIYSRDITICFLLAIFDKRVIYEDHEPKGSKIWLYQFFLKVIKKKVIVAKNLAELYKEFGIKEQTFRFIPNGVDLSSFDQVAPKKEIWHKDFKIDPKKRIILYVGHFYKWKGIYSLIDAAPKVDGAQIVLIGGTDTDYGRAEEYVKSKNIKNVSLHKFVSHSEIIEYIKSADILVLPNTAQEERSLKYTTPIKLFEYMASGVPIVASRVESFKNYLKDNNNAVMFEPDNAEDLANKVNNLLNNNNLVKKIYLQARQDVTEYSWERRAEKIINFLKA